VQQLCYFSNCAFPSALLRRLIDASLRDGFFIISRSYFTSVMYILSVETHFPSFQWSHVLIYIYILRAPNKR
jgi:hypothetical protein